MIKPRENIESSKKLSENKIRFLKGDMISELYGKPDDLLKYLMKYCVFTKDARIFGKYLGSITASKNDKKNKNYLVEKDYIDGKFISIKIPKLGDFKGLEYECFISNDEFYRSVGLRKNIREAIPTQEKLRELLESINDYIQKYGIYPNKSIEGKIDNKNDIEGQNIVGKFLISFLGLNDNDSIRVHEGDMVHNVENGGDDYILPYFSEVHNLVNYNISTCSLPTHGRGRLMVNDKIRIHTDVSRVTPSIMSLLTSLAKPLIIGVIEDIDKTLSVDETTIVNALNTTLNIENRTTLATYLGKIRDEQTRKVLKEKGIENPSQFQLFLQQCKPGQILLETGETKLGKGRELMYKATQQVSKSKRCHSAIISEVIEKNGVVTDVKMLQAADDGIQEASLTQDSLKYYKQADFMLCDFQSQEMGKKVLEYCKNYIGGKYSVFNLVCDYVFPYLKIQHERDNTYCSELNFKGMMEAGVILPEFCRTPADLLTTPALVPVYCCNCKDFTKKI